mmetsp:Transcript_15965/g.43506  ORF Transcript_15965/g.43506 Transcript_15965/m.43506 type:complete len:221 (+) Transcript_15965:1062-1724(+)
MSVSHSEGVSSRSRDLQLPTIVRCTAGAGLGAAVGPTGVHSAMVHSSSTFPVDASLASHLVPAFWPSTWWYFPGGSSQTLTISPVDPSLDRCTTTVRSRRKLSRLRGRALKMETSRIVESPPGGSIETLKASCGAGGRCCPGCCHVAVGVGITGLCVKDGGGGANTTCMHVWHWGHATIGVPGGSWIFARHRGHATTGGICIWYWGLGRTICDPGTHTCL